MRRIALAVVLTAAVVLPSPADAQTGQPPEITAIRATFAFPVTTYQVTVSDPDGDPLTFEWSKSSERECGTFTSNGDRADWSHPHPPCPDEPFHPGTITVRVSDGQWNVEAAYPDGSQEGLVEFQDLQATPAQTTTTTSSTTTTTAAPTTTIGVAATTEVEDEVSSDDGGGFPIIVLVLGGLAAAGILGWWLARQRGERSDPCPELRRRCAEATRAMEEAGRALDAAVAATAAAAERSRLADARLQAASRPPPEEAWIESEGERVTQHDLNLRVRAAGQAWGRYRAGAATAEQVEQEWRDLDEPGAREERRRKDEADRAQRLADAQAEAGAAAAALADATAAQAAAEAAYAAAVAAQREACAAAAECERAAAAAASAPPPSTPTPAPPPAPPPTEPTPPSTPDEPPEHAIHTCGPDFTAAFVNALNIIIRRLRTEGPDPTLMDIVDLASWLTVFPSPTKASGLEFVFNNGMNMDFWAMGDPECPCDHCPASVTLNGICVAPHTCNDSIYGLCCGWFGLPLEIQVAGGQYAEWLKGGPSMDDLNLEPQVSRDLYAAGDELGRRARSDPTFVVTAADLETIVAVATKYFECMPCATLGVPLKDFSTQTWVW